MVNLSFLSEDPTIRAVKEVAELNAEKNRKYRDYIGASLIGHSCERYIWYKYNTPEATRPIKWKGLFAIEDGHRTEKLIIERLLSVPGIEITAMQDEYVELDGAFRGHPEGIITGLKQAPQTPHILEVKCCNQKKYDNLQKLIEKLGEKNALQAWDAVYYAQAMILCYGFNCTRHYLVVSLPGGRDMISCRTEAAPSFAKALLQKADRIINIQNIPARIGENEDFYICRWCDMNTECWGR